MEDVATSTMAPAINKPAMQTAQLPLSFARMGQTVTVLKVRGKGELQHHLENLGFVDGAAVTVVCENSGNLIVEVKGAQVALSKDSALKVITAA